MSDDWRIRIELPEEHHAGTLLGELTVRLPGRHQALNALAALAVATELDVRFETVRDALVKAVNKDPKVSAYPAGVFTRIRLQARQPGAAGQGITYSASVNSGAKLKLEYALARKVSAGSAMFTAPSSVA